MTEINRQASRNDELYIRIEQMDIPEFQKVQVLAQLRRAEYIGDSLASLAGTLARCGAGLKRFFAKPVTHG